MFKRIKVKKEKKGATTKEKISPLQHWWFILQLFVKRRNKGFWNPFIT